MMTVKIVPNEKGNPPSKLADAELHFGPQQCFCPACNGDGELQVAESGPLAHAIGICATCDGKGFLQQDSPLDGLRLLGFSIWKRRGRNSPNVTFPARQYSVNGERWSFALLRPIVVDATAQDRLRDLILEAYEAVTRGEQ